MNQQPNPPAPPTGPAGGGISDARRGGTVLHPPVMTPAQSSLPAPSQIFQHQLRPLSAGQVELLMRDLDQWRVSSRSGNSYVEAHDIKNMLIRVFGFGGFSTETIESTIVFQQQVPQTNDKSKTNWKIASRAVVRLTIHQLGAVYQEAAVAGSSQPDWTESADMATKSAESDALKRAAIFLGTQFGLSLYADGALVDQVQILAEPMQQQMLAAERQRIYSEWERAQQPGNAAQPPQAPAGGPNGVQQPQPPAQAGSAAHAAAARSMQEGLNA